MFKFCSIQSKYDPKSVKHWFQIGSKSVKHQANTYRNRCLFAIAFLMHLESILIHLESIWGANLGPKLHHHERQIDAQMPSYVELVFA